MFTKINLRFFEGLLYFAHVRDNTYPSRANATAAWVIATMANDHVHLELGVYILGVLCPKPGLAEGYPSRW